MRVVLFVYSQALSYFRSLHWEEDQKVICDGDENLIVEFLCAMRRRSLMIISRFCSFIPFKNALKIDFSSVPQALPKVFLYFWAYSVFFGYVSKYAYWIAGNNHRICHLLQGVILRVQQKHMNCLGNMTH